MRFRRFASPAAFVFLLGCSNDVTTTSSSASSTASSGGAGGGGVTAATGTGGAGAGIGQPSDTYPAPHPKAPTVADLGGPVSANPVAVPIFFTGDDAQTVAGLTDFVATVGATNYWTKTTSEYGVGALTSAAPVTLDEVPAASISDADIQAWLGAKLNANDLALPPPDGANTIYTIFYPQNVTISLDGGGFGGTEYSCQSFGGYHSDFKLDAAHGNQTVAYAVIPRCQNFGPLNGLDAVTGTTSHELIEAATDPFPMDEPAFGQPDNNHLYWLFALGGGETGDMCAQFPGVFTTYSDLSYTAQRTWSNKAATAGHDPCVPDESGKPYFNAAPVLNDTLNFGGGLVVKGVKIPVGESKTIDVDLFSDGPTEPFTVSAMDSSGFMGGSQQLSFDFDEAEGQNGQVLHLTITALQANQYKAEIFYLVSQLGNHQNLWIGIVGN